MGQNLFALRPLPRGALNASHHVRADRGAVADAEEQRRALRGLILELAAFAEQGAAPQHQPGFGKFWKRMKRPQPPLALVALL